MESKTIKELKIIAKDLGIHGYSNLNKSDLIKSILKLQNNKERSLIKKTTEYKKDFYQSNKFLSKDDWIEMGISKGIMNLNKKMKLEDIINAVESGISPKKTYSTKEELIMKAEEMGIIGLNKKMSVEQIKNVIDSGNYSDFNKPIYTLEEIKFMAKEKGISYSGKNKFILCKELNLDCEIKSIHSKSLLKEIAKNLGISVPSYYNNNKICEILKIDPHSSIEINLDVLNFKIISEKDIDEDVKKKLQSKIYSLFEETEYIRKPMGNKKINKAEKLLSYSNEDREIINIFSKKRKDCSKKLNDQLNILDAYKMILNQNLDEEIMEEIKIKKIIEKEEESIRLSKDCIGRSKLVPKPHQMSIFNHFKKNKNKKGFVIAHEVGSGKTLLSILMCEYFLDLNTNHKIVVVLPKSLIANFVENLIEKYGASQHHINKYEYYTFNAFHRKFKDSNPYFLTDFFHNTMIIIDEAHKYRKMTAKETETILNCSYYARKVIPMTGTPVYNHPYDCIPLIIMATGKREMSRKSLENIIDENGNLIDNQYTRKYFEGNISIYKNVDRENYPSVEEKFIEVEMSDDLYFEYKLIEHNFKEDKEAEDQLSAKGNMVFYSGLRKSIAGLDPEKNPKYIYILNELLRLRNEFKKYNKTEKISKNYKSIIFSNYKDLGIRELIVILKKYKFKVAEYTGELDKETRKKLVQKYNNDELDILLITKAGGEGLDLKKTRKVFLVETGWNSSSEEQVIARAARFMSHESLPLSMRNVTVYHLIFVKPNKEKILTILDNKCKSKKLSEKNKKKLYESEEKESVDHILLKLVQKKKEYNNNFMESLYKYSIESIIEEKKLKKNKIGEE